MGTKKAAGKKTITNAAATPAPKRTVNRVKLSPVEKYEHLLKSADRAVNAIVKRATIISSEFAVLFAGVTTRLAIARGIVEALPIDWTPPSKITGKTELVDGTIVRIKAKHVEKYPRELYDADLSGELTYRSQIGKSVQCRIPPAGEGSGRIIVIPRSHLEFVRAPALKDPIDVNHDGNGTAVE